MQKESYKKTLDATRTELIRIVRVKVGQGIFDKELMAIIKDIDESQPKAVWAEKIPAPILEWAISQELK
jgi:hypothetical protein